MPVRGAAAVAVAATLLAALVLWRSGAVAWAMAAAVELQRSLHGALAGAARALARGDGAAVWSLAGLSALYGVAHAAGPGHGKALLGAVAVAGAERPAALVALAAAAALAQALSAIAVVYGSLALLALSPRAALATEAELFAPLAHGAAGVFGLVFAWRGLRALAGRGEACCHHHHHHHGHDAGAGAGGHWRDRAGLVAAVALRPCAGAMIVLAIAWMARAPWAGVAAAGAMALGVAAVTAAVALGGHAFRQASLGAGGTRHAARVAGGLQVAASGALCAFAAAGLA